MSTTASTPNTTFAPFVPPNVCQEMVITPPTVQCDPPAANDSAAYEAGWICELSAAGERLVQAQPAYREATLAQSDEGYLVRMP